MSKTEKVASAAPNRTFAERGVPLITLQYTIRDRETGTISERRLMIPTDVPIRHTQQTLYEAMIPIAASMRRRAPSGEAHFYLIDRANHIVGAVSLNIDDLSDQDLAWLNCLFVEIERAMLELVPERAIAPTDSRKRPDRMSKRKERRRRS